MSGGFRMLWAPSNSQVKDHMKSVIMLQEKGLSFCVPMDRIILKIRRRKLLFIKSLRFDLIIRKMVTALPSKIILFIVSAIYGNLVTGRPQWKKNPVHTYAAQGSYEVKLTGYNPCDEASRTMTVDLTTAVHDIGDVALELRPNPVENTLHVNFEGGVDDIQIQDMNGKSCDFEWSENGLTQHVLHFELAAGVYALQLTSEGRVYKRMFVVQ